MKENIEIFCSYAPEDQSSLDELKAHLNPPLLNRSAHMWDSGNISPGTDWKSEINEHLNVAQIILLLVSTPFLNSVDCQSHVERAMARHRGGEARVVPIILKPCSWDNQPFSRLQVLPTRNKPVTDWSPRNKAWLDVTKGILKTIDELPSKPVADRPLSDTTQHDTRGAPPAAPGQATGEEILKKELSPSYPPLFRKERVGITVALFGPKRSAVFTVALFVCVLVIVLASVLLNTISQSLNHGQPTAPLTHSTITIPPQSTSSVDAPMFGFDTQRTHFNPSEHILSPSTITSLKLHWKASIGTGIAETFFPSSPVVANSVVYVGSWDSKLYALNISTGKILWSAQTGGHITSSPTVVKGVVYIGSWDHKLYAFKADGCSHLACSPLWVSAPTGNSIFSSPVVDNGTIYVGSQDGKLYAYKTSGCDGDKSSCDPLWSVQMGLSITSSPAVDNGTVYVGSWDHKLYALDAATHTVKWSYTTGDIVWSSPAVANGSVYIGSADKKLYALDAKTGGFKWEYTTGNAIHSSPAVVNGVVYIGSDDGVLYSLKASIGKLLWKSAYVGAAFFSSPTIANGLVYLSSNNRTLYVYNVLGCGNGQLTCDPLQTSSGLSGPILSSPTVVNGAIYLSSQDGKLYAFYLSSVTP